MKILVFIKEISDSEAKIFIREGGKRIDVEDRYEINYFDQMAVEEAIKIKESLSEGEVVVCTLGEGRSVEALRSAIAMGADRAVLIDKKGLTFYHPLLVSSILARFAKREGFDLIFCGKKELDFENGTVGIMLAAMLGIPCVDGVRNIEIVEKERVIAKTERDGKTYIVEVMLPAVFTADKGLNEPRVPSISGVMRAMSKEINVLDLSSLYTNEDRIKLENEGIKPIIFESPGKRPPVKIIEGKTAAEKVKNLVEILKSDKILPL